MKFKSRHIKGKGRGKKMGFPTINLKIPSNFKLEDGIYAAKVFIEDKVLVDLKTKPFIEKEDYYQMKRYLVASGKKLDLIINFRQKYLAPKRILN